MHKLYTILFSYIYAIYRYAICIYIAYIYTRLSIYNSYMLYRYRVDSIIYYIYLLAISILYYLIEYKSRCRYLLSTSISRFYYLILSLLAIAIFNIVYIIGDVDAAPKSTTTSTKIGQKAQNHISIAKSTNISNIDESTITRCIIGEAASEGKTGMIAVAEAIRNRRSIDGVYGCRAKFVDDEPKWVWNLAKEAWRLSLTSTLTKGATHWESTDFKTPYWAKEMEITSTIGKHVFYKERR